MATTVISGGMVRAPTGFALAVADLRLCVSVLDWTNDVAGAEAGTSAVLLPSTVDDEL
jgi:hypothetical protein